MKKINYLSLLLIASATCISISSCGKTPSVDDSSASQSTPTSIESLTEVSSESSESSFESVETSLSEQAPDTSSIAMNGTSYKTIKEALAAIPAKSSETFKITLPKGTYNENGLSYNGSANIIISGNTTEKFGTDVIIKGHGSDMTTEKTRDLIEIQGSGNIILENLTLESDWLRNDERTGDVQSEVLGTDTKGNTVAYNCSFKSHQDTLRTAGKAWFYDCHIEGDVDFMWMETDGIVALYENCEIVSLYDQYAKTHNSYLVAPRMAVSNRVGKGLVIYNSIVKESDEAISKNQKTYLARTPWSSGFYNQVAYINTTCSGIEATPWYGSQIATDYDKTMVGWKMDQFTASSIGYKGNNDILDDDTVTNEYSGRKAILNRIYDASKNKFVKDTVHNWDIESVISSMKWEVTEDTSSDMLSNETINEETIYKFDGSEDQSSLCNGFAKEGEKSHYVGKEGNTITIPVSGKCYVEVYGYYSGTATIKAGDQGESTMRFYNGTTQTEIEHDYVVYDENAKSIVITALDTTYITRVVITSDPSISFIPVTNISITGSTTNYVVGVPLTLTTSVTPLTATNKNVKWSSSNPEIATIDSITGTVSFVSAGEVTFTATACDGSGVSKTFTCTSINASWVAAEWYTTDSNLSEENSADGIGNFNCNSSSIKDLKGEFTYTNIAGKNFVTKVGLKLNGTGKLTIATTKAATLTIVVADVRENYTSLVTDTPKVSNGTNTITPTITSTDTCIIYTYTLDIAGIWDITRSGSKESLPIIYAKVEYPQD